MIKNERQYKITRSSADEVRNTIGELQRTPLPDGLQPEMRELQLDALRGTLGDLEAGLAGYDALHDATLVEAVGIEQLPTALIRARIACGRRADRTEREARDPRRNRAPLGRSHPNARARCVRDQAPGNSTRDRDRRSAAPSPDARPHDPWLLD